MKPTHALPFLLLLIAACTTPAPGTPGATGTAGTRAATSPQPKASSPVSVSDLSGVWVFGGRNEPGAGPVETCRPDESLSLTHEGTQVTGTVSSCAGACNWVENTEGTLTGTHLTLAGTYQGNLDRTLGKPPAPVSYDLTYDPASQHLRGTRDGNTFWAAPLYQGPSCSVAPSAIPPLN